MEENYTFHGHSLRGGLYSIIEGAFAYHYTSGKIDGKIIDLANNSQKSIYGEMNFLNGVRTLEFLSGFKGTSAPNQKFFLKKVDEVDDYYGKYLGFNIPQERIFNLTDGKVDLNSNMAYFSENDSLCLRKKNICKVELIVVRVDLNGDWTTQR